MAKASALLNTKTGLSCRNTDLSQTRLSFCLDAFDITSCGHWSVSICSILMSFDGLDSRKAPFPYLSHHLTPPKHIFQPYFGLSFVIFQNFSNSAMHQSVAACLDKGNLTKTMPAPCLLILSKLFKTAIVIDNRQLTMTLVKCGTRVLF